MKAVFDHAEPVANRLVTFWFRPEKPVRYVAGQFTELYLPHTADARGERRWFTLSSSPTEPLLAITTRFAADNERHSSFKRELARLQPGTEVVLAEPMGDFVLPKDTSIPLLFVAAGAGITPVRSMAKYLADSGEKRHAQLLYAVSRAEDLAFADIFGAAGIQLTPLVKTQPAAHGGGALTSKRILQHIGGAAPYVYLSGPEIMVESLFRELRAVGIPGERLVVDYFHGYGSV
ncbi:MAG TPA: FAD-dependent oxidoreductase [Candidatus Saccharimonadales bacterium]|nr:FAD-dependent oxidoreductase [Candidatus Saccharimonadales bacterium]